MDPIPVLCSDERLRILCVPLVRQTLFCDAIPLCLHIDASKNGTAKGNDYATKFLKAKGVFKCWKWALNEVGLQPSAWTNGLLRLIKAVVADAKAKVAESADKADAEADVLPLVGVFPPGLCDHSVWGCTLTCRLLGIC